MYLIFWEFTVAAGKAEQFRASYGPRGDWARLFARAAGYLATELLESAAEPGRFITVDRWSSAEAFARFRREFKASYEELDRQCEGLTLSERRLGDFTLVK